MNNIGKKFYFNKLILKVSYFFLAFNFVGAIVFIICCFTFLAGSPNFVGAIIIFFFCFGIFELLFFLLLIAGTYYWKIEDDGIINGTLLWKTKIFFNDADNIYIRKEPLPSLSSIPHWTESFVLSKGKKQVIVPLKNLPDELVGRLKEQPSKDGIININNGQFLLYKDVVGQKFYFRPRTYYLNILIGSAFIVGSLVFLGSVLINKSEKINNSNVYIIFSMLFSIGLFLLFLSFFKFSSYWKIDTDGITNGSIFSSRKICFNSTDKFLIKKESFSKFNSNKVINCFVLLKKNEQVIVPLENFSDELINWLKEQVHWNEFYIEDEHNNP